MHFISRIIIMLLSLSFAAQTFADSTETAAPAPAPTPEKWEQIAPIIPQCTPGEPGCSTFQDSFIQFFDPYWAVAKVNRHKSKIKRFTGFDGGEGCQESFGGDIHLAKQDCHTFDEAPVGDMTLNYVLPNSKAQDACNITMYDGKGCRGKIVWQINGYNSVNAYNGQRYCHKAPWGKSIIVGPCL